MVSRRLEGHDSKQVKLCQYAMLRFAVAFAKKASPILKDARQDSKKSESSPILYLAVLYF